MSIAGAHSDWGILTILATREPGLQLLRGGTWVDVEPIEGTFLVNLGDMLERYGMRTVVARKSIRHLTPCKRTL